VAAAELICVVDDDRGLLASIVDLVAALGYAVAGFGSAEAFMSSPEIERCRCVLADLKMPGMSGLDLKQAMTARGILTPMIIMTALASEKWPRLAAECGAAFLQKPFDADALATQLARSVAS
jgi:FixJ family two-component response regulator